MYEQSQTSLLIGNNRKNVNNKIGVKKYITKEILDDVAYLKEVSEIRIIKKIDKNKYLLT